MQLVYIDTLMEQFQQTDAQPLSCPLKPSTTLSKKDCPTTKKDFAQDGIYTIQRAHWISDVCSNLHLPQHFLCSIHAVTVHGEPWQGTLEGSTACALPLEGYLQDGAMVWLCG
jgi:hypothetical protein